MDGGVRSGRNVKKVVWRALQFAGGLRAGDRNDAGSGGSNGGPVYLMGAREVMEEEIPEEWHVKGTEKELKKWSPVKSSVLPAEAISEITEALVSADKPLIVIGYTGRNHASPAELVKLADTIKGVRVFNSGASEMSFPASHPAFLGSKAGPDATEAIRTADVIPVLDCDVPWMHTQCRPNEDATIFHIDRDSLKERMSLFYIEAQARYQADTYLVLKQLNSLLGSDAKIKEQLSSPTRNSRYDKILSAHSARMARLDKISAPPADPNSPITVPVLVRLLRNALPEDTIFVAECVTNTALVAEQIRPIFPGAWITGGGGGLGWSGGAALGVKLASDHVSGGPGTGKMVVQFVGDGSFMFSVPSSVY
jgi:thiamine pyrophosphate-dependent acetolactate synthase large subunit-like protein